MRISKTVADAMHEFEQKIRADERRKIYEAIRKIPNPCDLCNICNCESCKSRWKWEGDVEAYIETLRKTKKKKDGKNEESNG